MSATKNGLFFSDWLRKNGYSDQLISKYRKSGWLATLDKGVMYRTGDSLSSFAALSCYNTQLNKKVRVAAHSALELFGYNHYVPMGKPLLMVAYPNSTTPKWMSNDSFDKTIKPFSTKMIDTPQTSTIRIDGVDVLVSSPEQAFMECLLLTPEQYNYMDLYYIMEHLTSLRAEVVQTLLENIKNQRVKRVPYKLKFVFSEIFSRFCITPPQTAENSLVPTGMPEAPQIKGQRRRIWQTTRMNLRGR